MLLWAVFLQVSHSLSVSFSYFVSTSLILVHVFISPFSYLGVFVFFSVAGLIDSMIYHSSRALQKKIDLGKAT